MLVRLIKKAVKPLKWCELKLPRFPFSRLVYGGMAVLTLGIITVPVAKDLADQRRYQLAGSSQSIVGVSNTTLTNKLNYDFEKKLYQFNKQAFADSQSDTNASPQDVAAKLMQQKVGGTKDPKSKQLYSLDLPEKMADGITVYDNNLGIHFKIVPHYDGMSGRLEKGHLIYPIDVGQIVFSLKGNGLKEDILLNKPTKDTMAFRYTLELPSSLEARKQIDGSIGIYSGDPTLFGNISYGSDAERDRVMRARIKSPKTNLVFVIPAPKIIQSGKQKPGGKASFELAGNVLSLKTSGLKQLSYPLSIDPTVVFTSSSDFDHGNAEDNIDYTVAGQITRGGLTGGSILANLTTQTSFTTARAFQTSVVYNDIIYVVGGTDGLNGLNDIQYASLNTDGTINGAWSTVTYTTLNHGWYAHTSLVYNGFLYIIGGQNQLDGFNTNVLYSKLDPITGVPGAWQSQSAPFVRARHGSVVYNGNIYVMEGITCGIADGTSTCPTPTGPGTDRVVYAPVKADGSLGTWVSNPTKPSVDRLGQGAAVFNGYVYLTSGQVDGGAYYTKTDYAQINSDGSLGIWVVSNVSIAGRKYHATFINSGYIYLVGGETSVGSVVTERSNIIYAALSADGSPDIFHSTYTLGAANARTGLSAVSYHNSLTVLGGKSGTTYSTLVQNGIYDIAGVASNFIESLAAPLITARSGHATVAYNGFLYVIGGYTGTAYTATVEVAPIDNTDIIGTWVATTSLPAARGYLGAAVNNGYIYAVGGRDAAAAAYNQVYYAKLNTNGTIPSTGGAGSTWTAAANAFPTARAGLAVTLQNDRLYVLGGTDTAGTDSALVQFSNLDIAGGTGLPGAWAATSTNFTARDKFGVAVNNGYIYAVLGQIAGVVTNSIQYAAIDSNLGTIGTFATLTASPGARSGVSVGIFNGYLYMAGGINPSNVSVTAVNYIKLSTTNGNGVTGQAVATDILSPRYDTALAIANGKMYVTGGCTGICDAANTFNKSTFSTFNNGGTGTLDSFTTTGSTALPAARSSFGAVAYNGFMYIMGGKLTGGADTAAVYSAPIGTDGTVGAWTAQTAMPATRSAFGSVTVNGYVYILGGLVAGATTGSNTVIYAALNNGSVTSWSSVSAPNFTNGRLNLAVATYNNYIYILGGRSDTATTTMFADVQTIKYDTVANNGSLVSWAPTTSFTGTRYTTAAIAYNGYIYVLGGTLAGAVSDDRTQYGTINTSTGAVTNWQFTASSDKLRSNATAFVYNGYIYLIAGIENTAAGSTTQYASISPNGSIGNWRTSSKLTVPRASAQGILYNGLLYQIGGLDGGSLPLASIERASLNSIPRVARWSILLDMGAVGGLNNLNYSGVLPNGNADVSYRYAGANAVFTTIPGLIGSALGTNGAFCTINNGIQARYLLITVKMDESQVYSVFTDDQATTGSLVTDITVDFTTASNHPTTNVRLRTGKTLVQGTGKTPYDICFP